MGDNRWNACLLSGVTLVLLRAVKTLNDAASLRYSWIQYLSTNLSVSSLSEL